MSEGSPPREKLEDYVEVLLDYQYVDRGQAYTISKGETLMVLKRSNNVWWQVIREGSYRAFYAPAQHLQHKDLSEKEMKRIISGHSTSNENVALARRSQELDGRGAFPPQGFPPSDNTQPIQAFRPYPGHLNILPSHISQLCVNEVRAESQRRLAGKPVIKSKSIDELRSGERYHSTLDVTKMREASSEELDRRSSAGMQLSPRLRSSSFDLRMPPKDTEMKVWSLDKPRHSGISKDQGDRRRSWALENLRPSLKRGETVDAAIVLDVPPELPPKTKPKRGLTTFHSNPENVGHLEGPIDLKVEQARMTKSGLPSSGNEQHGVEGEMRHSRHSSDPLLLLEEKTSFPLYHGTLNGKDPPVALPRTLLPQQTAPLEDRLEVLSLVGDNIHRDANGNKVKKSSSQNSLANMPFGTNEGSSKAQETLGSFRYRSRTYESSFKPSSTPEAITKSNSSSLPSQKCRSESPKVTVKSKISQSFGSFRKNSKKEAKKEEREKDPPPRETLTPDSLRRGKIMQTPPSPLCPPQRTLSGDWAEYFDQASRRPYYYNSITREKRWKPPRKGVSSNPIPEVKVPSSVTENNNSRGTIVHCPPPKCPTPDYPTSPRLSHKPFSYTGSSDTPQLHPINTRAAIHNSSSIPHPIPSQPFTNSIPPATHSISPPQKPGKQKVLPLALSTLSTMSTPPSVPPSSAKPTLPTTPTTAKPTFPTFPTTPTTPEFTDLTASTGDTHYALLDILYKMELPQGWEKKYDAFNQRIYFYNRVTRERPRGVSCVSELDVAHLNDKQYVRKSYQSNMDLSKELQLDANVIEDDQSVAADNMASSASFVNVSREQGTVWEQKGAPPKPPRTAKEPVRLSFSLVPDKMVINPNRPRQVEGQGSRYFGSPTDHPSVVERSRLSSFGVASSFPKPHGHHGSRAESMRVSPIVVDPSVTQGHCLAVGETMLDASKVASQSPSFTQELARKKSPVLSPKVLLPQSSRAPALPPRSHDSHTKEDIRSFNYTLPRLTIGEKGKITGDIHGKQLKQDNIYKSLGNLENVDYDSNQANAMNVAQSSKMHKDLLKELNTHTHSLRPIGGVSSTPDALAEQDLPDVTLRRSADNKCSEEAFLLNTPFTLSKMSRLNQSQKPRHTRGKRSRKHSADDITEPRSLIRNSSFIAHDEDGSILEDKSLSHLLQPAASGEGGKLQPGWPMEMFLFPSKPLSCSEMDEVARNYDSEEISPTCYNGRDSREGKNFQDFDKWLATTSDEGKVYYYEESGTKSAWRLPEVDDADLRYKESHSGLSLPSPLENYRLSNITENLSELSDSIVREGFIHRTFLMRDGKKVRKNWTHSYTRYIVRAFNAGCSGILYFTKTKDDEKKPEIFEFYPPCCLEHSSDKKTSRQQVLGLRNGHDTEILLQFEEKEIGHEWFKLLDNHEGVKYYVNTTEKEDKKLKKGAEKIKRQTSVEQLNPDSKGIKDKLRNFIKRRPMKETLENKGIYKGKFYKGPKECTLAELKFQDKTNIPIFVLLCIRSIEQSEENLQTDGLYRISGNAALIQKIRFEVAQRKYEVLSQEKEIHNLSGALKLFFRELKEPLIPYDNYDDFIRATGSEYRRMNQQADKLTKAINRLPIENRDTLKILIQHLLRVSEYESENRMSLFNLAIVFGPCLMWPKVTLSHDLMTDVMLHNRVVEGLLSDFHKVFSKR
ncbi:Rho GTPase-activating protein 12 [Chionoecetes opilio]|uniref:Rho GTPase-activating protein 12 n=1 Tax=Chionoecetes opilio TaxID=41210 RepID=A0A8J4YDN0_CHIOP|nr:Rho GTPase-activating protein 12 [Chionoecetes opilio]